MVAQLLVAIFSFITIFGQVKQDIREKTLEFICDTYEYEESDRPLVGGGCIYHYFSPDNMCIKSLGCLRSSCNRLPAEVSQEAKDLCNFARYCDNNSICARDPAPFLRKTYCFSEKGISQMCLKILERDCRQESDEPYCRFMQSCNKDRKCFEKPQDFIKKFPESVPNER